MTTTTLNRRIDKNTQTLKKLQSTLAEMTVYVTKLKRQRDAWMEYKSLKDSLLIAKTTLAAVRIAQYETDITAMQQKIDAQRKQGGEHSDAIIEAIKLEQMGYQVRKDGTMAILEEMGTCYAEAQKRVSDQDNEPALMKKIEQLSHAIRRVGAVNENAVASYERYVEAVAEKEREAQAIASTLADDKDKLAKLEKQ